MGKSHFNARQDIAEPVDEEQFNYFDWNFRSPDFLIAAISYQDETWILSSYWPDKNQAPQLYFGPVFLPSRSGGGGFLPIKDFIEKHGDELSKLKFTKQVNLLKQGLHKDISFQKMLTEMRTGWTQTVYHAKKNEQDKLDRWLGNRTTAEENIQENRVISNQPGIYSEEVKSTGIKKEKEEAVKFISPIAIFFIMLPLALICGYLFSSTLDNASPVDGAMIGAVTGFFLYLVLLLFGCRSLGDGFKAGFFLSIIMFLVGHIQWYMDKRDLIESSELISYEQYLENVLKEDVDNLFIAHLRAQAMVGTTALEKAWFPRYQHVYRQGKEVWIAWFMQFVWCLVFVWAGVLFGFEHHLRRENSQ